MSDVLDVSALAAPLGAVIQGVDLRNPLTAGLRRQIRDALTSHLLLIVRGQFLSPVELLAFATVFGEPVVHRFVPGLADHAPITEIRKEPEHLHNYGGAWHFDLSFLPCPPAVTVLLAKEVPASGGDTLWSNQYLAYASLPKHMQERVGELSAEHTSEIAFNGFGHDSVSTVHPLAPIHPLTRRHYLYANPVSISRLLGPGGEDDQALLTCLYGHATQPHLQYRHHWMGGDVLVWDNRATMHIAMNDYPGRRRVMLRVAVTDSPDIS